MAKLIVNSCYIKSSSHFLNYLEYAGKKLEAQSITLNSGEVISCSSDETLHLSDDVKSVNIQFKDGHRRTITPERYRLMTQQKTQEFEAADLYDVNGKVQKECIDPAAYLNYIATRPSVEKIQGYEHGLFDLHGAVDIEKAKSLAEQYGKNIKWSHIVSLKREDAQRTGYDNRAAWEALIRAKAPAIAKQYNISMENLVLNCAYHDKDNHPHIHLFIYSKDKREGFVKGGKEALTRCSQKVKSLLFNEIFKEDVGYLKEQKNEREHTLEARLKELSATIAHKSHLPPTELMVKTQALAQKLNGENGKRVYGYLSPALKQEVNNVLKCAIEQDTALNEAFSEYLKTYRVFIEQYIDTPEKIDERLHQIRERLLSPQTKEDSTTLQNIIIKGILQYNTVLSKQDNAEAQHKKNDRPLYKKEKEGYNQSEAKTQCKQPTTNAAWLRQQRLLLACVKSMLYGLCSSFAQSADDTASTMGHRKGKNITLCKNKGKRSAHENKQERAPEAFIPTQF